MSLFDEDDESDEEFDSPPELATPKLVRLLEGFSYRREAVRKWTKEKAETVLRSCQREQRIALRRAAATAGQIDGEKRGQASALERQVAATYVQQVLDGRIEPDELLQALAYSLHVSTDDELKRLAGYLVRLWNPPAPSEENAA